MKKRLPIITVLTLFMALGLSCLAEGDSIPMAKRGILDLRRVNLFAKPVSISGEWGFYRDRLLPPDSLSSATPAYIPYPLLWSDVVLNGTKIPSQGYATYTLTILLPSKRPRLGLEVPEKGDAAYYIHIDRYNPGPYQWPPPVRPAGGKDVS